MWILYLDDMRAPSAEALVPVARAETKEELEAFLSSESVKPYTDYPNMESFERWAKCYRKGGPLEWFNPPYGKNLINVGTLDHWKAQAEQKWEEHVMSVKPVSEFRGEGDQA